KLHPGTVLELNDAQQCGITLYFDLGAEALAAQHKPRKKPDDYAEEFDALFGDAVRMRMVADVPLGGFLSGGIDSSLVVAHMTKSAEADVRTFTMGFDEVEFDESPHALRIAQALGVTAYVDKLSAQRVLSELGRVIQFYDEPIADFSTLPTSALSS